MAKYHFLITSIVLLYSKSLCESSNGMRNVGPFCLTCNANVLSGNGSAEYDDNVGCRSTETYAGCQCIDIYFDCSANAEENLGTECDQTNQTDKTRAGADVSNNRYTNNLSTDTSVEDATIKPPIAAIKLGNQVKCPQQFKSCKRQLKPVLYSYVADGYDFEIYDSESRRKRRYLLSYTEEQVDEYVYDDDQLYQEEEEVLEAAHTLVDSNDDYEFDDDSTVRSFQDNDVSEQDDGINGKEARRRHHGSHGNDNGVYNDSYDRRIIVDKHEAFDGPIQPPSLLPSSDDVDDDDNDDDDDDDDDEPSSTHKPTVKSVVVDDIQYEYDQEEVSLKKTLKSRKQKTEEYESRKETKRLEKMDRQERKEKVAKEKLSQERARNDRIKEAKNKTHRSGLKDTLLELMTGKKQKATNVQQHRNPSNMPQEIDGPDGMMIIVPTAKPSKRDRHVASDDIEYDYDYDTQLHASQATHNFQTNIYNIYYFCMFLLFFLHSVQLQFLNTGHRWQ